MVEVFPRKKRSLFPEETSRLKARLEGGDEGALVALLEGSGWAGVPRSTIPQRLGFTPQRVGEVAEELLGAGKGMQVEGHLFASSTWKQGREKVLVALTEFHAAQPLRPGMALQELRQLFPSRTGPGLGEAIIQSLSEDEELVLEKGLVRLSSFSPQLTKGQKMAREGLRTVLQAAGLKHVRRANPRGTRRVRTLTARPEVLP